LKFDFASMPEIRTTFKGAARIGLGSGRTVAGFLEAASESRFINKKAVYYASSSQIAEVAERLGLTLGDPSHIHRLQVMVDGADQLLPGGWFVKGGGGALFREKLLWKQSDVIIVMASKDKKSDQISVPVPIEVHPWGVKILTSYIGKNGGSAELRRLDRNIPFVTENGNFIVDATLRHLRPELYSATADTIKGLTGVVEVGLFHDEKAIVYHPYGPANGQTEDSTEWSSNR